MALLNVMFPGSYTTIENVTISRGASSVSFDIFIWSGSDKSTLVSRIYKSLSMVDTCLEIDRTTVKSDAVDWPIGRVFKVSSSPTDENLKPDTFMYLSAFGLSEPNLELPLFDPTDNKYYLLVNGTFVHQKYVVDSRVFANFSTEVLALVSNTPAKLCYEYIKTLPEYMSSTDV